MLDAGARDPAEVRCRSTGVEDVETSHQSSRIVPLVRPTYRRSGTSWDRVPVFVNGQSGRPRQSCWYYGLVFTCCDRIIRLRPTKVFQQQKIVQPRRRIGIFVNNEGTDLA